MTPRLARVLVTGSRDWSDRQRLADVLLDMWHDALQDGYTGVLLTHGAAEDGADALAAAWAVENEVPQDPYPADWEGPCSPGCRPGHRRPRRGRDYCPQAGHRRNQTMVDLQPTLCVAFVMPCTQAACQRPRPHPSHGTADCMRRARKAGIPIYQINP